ncbi:retrovirus-related Pol polyprotein from transposon 412 [Trichonephila clavipes]|nr:retrovirus-related Pol polyprotein from transposon 412 [Trichonephila clavipes]
MQVLPERSQLSGTHHLCKGVRTDPEKVSALKEALTSSPILIYPQPDKPFILDTDASNESVGAVLSQEIDGQGRVVAYWRRHPIPGDEKVREDQMADPDIKPLIEFMESSSNKPSWQDISAYSPTTKQLGPLEFSTSQEWCSIPKIRIRGWKDIQVAISISSISYPRGTDLHGSPTGGHFGVMKTFAPSSRAILLKVKLTWNSGASPVMPVQLGRGQRYVAEGSCIATMLEHPSNVSLSISWDLCQGLRLVISTYLLSWTTSRKSVPHSGSGSPHRSGGCSAALDIEIWGTSSTSFRREEISSCGIEGGL